MAEQKLTLHPTTRAYLVATIVLVVLLGVTILFYVLGIGNGKLPTTNTVNNSPQTNTSNNSAPNVLSGTTAPPEPSVILMRNGVVKSTGNDSIRFETPVYDPAKRQYAMTEMTASVTTETLFFEIDNRTPPQLPLPGQPTPTRATRAISLSDIRFGDTIEATSSENISAKTTFTAKEIRKIILPK